MNLQLLSLGGGGLFTSRRLPVPFLQFVSSGTFSKLGPRCALDLRYLTAALWGNTISIPIFHVSSEESQLKTMPVCPPLTVSFEHPTIKYEWTAKDQRHQKKPCSKKNRSQSKLSKNKNVKKSKKRKLKKKKHLCEFLQNKIRQDILSIK